MNKELEAKYLQLEESRKRLMDKLAGVDKRLLEGHANGKWSVAQIMYHLNRAESQSTLYVSKKMKGAATMKPSGILAAIRILLSKIAFALPVKFKAPKVLGEVPAEVKYAEIKEEWDETRNKLGDLLASIPEHDLKKELFKQPIAGRMNIYQMLDFMQSHFDRHAKQIVSSLH